MADVEATSRLKFLQFLSRYTAHISVYKRWPNHDNYVLVSRPYFATVKIEEVRATWIKTARLS